MNEELLGPARPLTRWVEGIILVDDEDDVLRSLARDIRSWTRSRNLTVYPVHSGEECLDLVREKYPSIGLVVSDLRMPGMSGADLFIALNDAYPDIGCVMVTAYADMDQITRALSSSMMGLIQKPWTPDELQADLDRALEQVEYRRSAEERNRELNQQLELAGAFQKAAMAVTIPPDERVEYQGFSRPAKEMHVTGDFNDFLRLDRDRYLLLVGDVSGHGMRAALLSAMLKIVVRSYVDRGQSLGRGAGGTPPPGQHRNILLFTPYFRYDRLLRGGNCRSSVTDAAHCQRWPSSRFCGA